MNRRFDRRIDDSIVISKEKNLNFLRIDDSIVDLKRN